MEPSSLTSSGPAMSALFLSPFLSLKPFSFQASALLRAHSSSLLDWPSPLPHSPIVLTVAKCWDPSPQAYFTLPRSEWCLGGPTAESMGELGSEAGPLGYGEWMEEGQIGVREGQGGSLGLGSDHLGGFLCLR